MNDNISHDKDARMTDAQLDGLLDALKAPPAPSDLLRARLANAAVKGPPAGPPQAADGNWFLGRQAFYGRIAAALCLAALVGMAAWLPAPGSSGDGAGTRLAGAPLAPVSQAPEAWDSATVQSGTDMPDTGPALALVGGDGAAISGVGLVQASWSGAAVAQADEGGELDEISLD
jgi:hypothetical protein